MARALAEVIHKVVVTNGKPFFETMFWLFYALVKINTETSEINIETIKIRPIEISTKTIEMNSKNH